VVYQRPPPLLGEHNDDVLGELLGLGADERRALREQGII
jgi:crotonobetainyl-CoA:carnitine CoA-transferase CaiB-like acyl-CoA transferase